MKEPTRRVAVVCFAWFLVCSGADGSGFPKPLKSAATSEELVNHFGAAIGFGQVVKWEFTTAGRELIIFWYCPYSGRAACYVHAYYRSRAKQAWVLLFFFFIDLNILLQAVDQVFLQVAGRHGRFGNFAQRHNRSSCHCRVRRVICDPDEIMRARWLASGTRSEQFSTLSIQSSTVMTRAIGSSLPEWNNVLNSTARYPSTGPKVQVFCLGLALTVCYRTRAAGRPAGNGFHRKRRAGPTTAPNLGYHH